MPIQMAYSPTEDSVAPERCLWTSKNHGQSTAPTTTTLYPISPHSPKPLRARIACDIPERIFKTQVSFHLVQDPHLRPGRQKHRRLAPSGSLDTLCILMWRMLYQKITTRSSSNFRQLTANEEVRHHPWRGLLYIPITHPLHRRNVRRRSSDCSQGYPPFFFVSFVLYF